MTRPPCLPPGTHNTQQAWNEAIEVSDGLGGERNGRDEGEQDPDEDTFPATPICHAIHFPRRRPPMISIDNSGEQK